MTKPIFDNLAIGDLITFGSYEQDYDTRKPEKPISWKVLDEVEGCYLLISEYGLDVEPYDFEYQDMTWENCSLRAWLNSDFFDSAFSEEEKQIIKTAQVKAEDNPEYGTKAGNDTQDKVFLLNISEAEKYFSSDESRQCKATGYAVYDGAWVDATTGAYEWWLRSPGENNSYAATVNSYGSIDYEGGNLFEVVVRPALWINP